METFKLKTQKIKIEDVEKYFHVLLNDCKILTIEKKEVIFEKINVKILFEEDVERIIIDLNYEGKKEAQISDETLYALTFSTWLRATNELYWNKIVRSLISEEDK